MHAKWVWSCHENLCKDHESTILSTQDAWSYLIYVDDSYLQGDSYEESCLKNVNDTIIMLRSLDFTIHPEKLVLKPIQNLIYLGFIINSKDMTLKLIEEKKQKICDLCTKLFEKSKPTIRFVAQVIGNIVSSFPAVPLGPLFYNGNIRNRQDCRNQKTQIEL